MSHVSQDRRRFLQRTAQLAAASVLPLPLRRALSTPAAGRTGTLHDIEHVVILTQENRSFDHYFGTLPGVCGFEDPAAIRLPNGAPVWCQPCRRHRDGHLMPFAIDTRETSGVCSVAPEMSYPTDLRIWNEGRFDAWNTARDPGLGMGYLRRDDLPFYYALADAFTVCDQYFCSTLTQTNPNRLHLFTGSNGLSVGAAPALDNTVPGDGFEWTTYAELLEREGVSWRVYQERDNFDDNALAWFARFRAAKAGSALQRRGMAHVPDLVAAFAEDVRRGTLPNVSWIVAPEHLSEHASYRPSDGEDLCARLLAALAANPVVRSRTVFILNYDEQGGWFDHVPPPMPPATAEQGASTVSVAGEIHHGKPIGLGFRVPMLVVSPWSAGGQTCSEVFDHTSVLRLLERRFGVECPNISPWRRAVCGDLTSALDFTGHEHAWPSLPATRAFRAESDRLCRARPEPAVPNEQSKPTQEAGARPRRELPYRLLVTAEPAGGGVRMRFDNRGAAGAAFQLFDLEQGSAPPLRYTVEAGKSLEALVPARDGADHALEVLGPAGSFWQFGRAVADRSRGRNETARA